MASEQMPRSKAKKEYKFGLRPVRNANQYPKVVRAILLGDLLLRCILLAYLWSFPKPSHADFRKNGPRIFSANLIWCLIIEFASSSMFLVKFGRWEEHGHLITFWEVLSSFLAFAVRNTLYTNPIFFLLVSLGLVSAYVIGLMTELTGSVETREPPFVPKKNDKHRPNYGWLGPWIAHQCDTRLSRNAVTTVLFLSKQTFLMICWLFYHTNVDVMMKAFGDNLDMIFYILIGLTALTLMPNMIIDVAVLPEFISDFKNGKRASNGCKTEPFEVAMIDEDNLDDIEACGEMKIKLKDHKCCAITVVIPCYMPNEEEIIFDVLDYYRKQGERYPGELKVLVVWNSPDSHYELEDKFNDLKQEWPGFKWRRDLLSTSKCDNLNTAIDYLDTEVALLNDADTMVSAETMVRASMHITGGSQEEQFDIAQCHSTYCAEDVRGYPESGFFCFGALITMGDSSKPRNMATQGIFKHSPFNGRGGFWRVSALKLVGFDHRSIGEDHDAGYRAIAFYGAKGVLDPNMLCQEREPPDCASLTKQRIRWETAALEMRRTFPWVLRSDYYSSFEAFVLIWSQLYANANLPLQFLPMQFFVLLSIPVTKCFLFKHVFGGTEVSWQALCGNEHCIAHFKVHGQEVALPLALVVLLSIFVVMVSIWMVECLLRCSTTRSRPRVFFCLNAVFLAPFTMGPFLLYCQFGALRDYCFGDAKFIATKRSPSSDKLSSMGSMQKIGSQGSMTGLGSNSNLKGLGSNSNLQGLAQQNGSLAAPLLGGQ